MGEDFSETGMKDESNIGMSWSRVDKKTDIKPILKFKFSYTAGNPSPQTGRKGIFGKCSDDRPIETRSTEMVRFVTADRFYPIRGESRQIILKPNNLTT